MSWKRVLTGSALGREWFGACEWNNRMIIAGGYDGTDQLNDVWESIDGVKWNKLCDGVNSFSKRDSLVLLVHDNCLYVIGGYDGSGYFSDVWMSRDGTKWTRVKETAFLPARDDHAAFSLNGRIYLVGGDDSATAKTYMDDVWMSPDGTTWTRIKNDYARVQRTVPAYCVFNNRMHLINGYDGTTRFDTASISADGEHWDITGPTCGLPACDDTAACVFDNKIVVTGGYSTRLQVVKNSRELYFSKDGEKYNCGQRDMGFGVYAHKLVALKNPNRLFSLFGYDGSAVRDDVWMSTGDWEDNR